MDIPNIYGYARAAGFTEAEAVTAAAIAFAESSGQVNQVSDRNNPSQGCKSIGLWQINICPGRETEPVFNEAALYTPLGNAKAAYARYQQQGWRAWTVYRTGAYRQYLDTARAAATSGNLGSIAGDEAKFHSCLERARIYRNECLGYDPDTEEPDPDARPTQSELDRCLNLYEIDRGQCARMYRGEPLETPNTDPCGLCAYDNIPACVACIGSELTSGLKKIGINLILGVAVAVGLYFLVKD